MVSLKLQELATIVEGVASHIDPRAGITGFATDSREVHRGNVFLAIRGQNVDGHDFVESAISAGAACAITEREVNAPHIRVANLVEALAKLATHYRDKFSGPVVAITGSAGKTTTKEFIGEALSPLGKVLKTDGNRNTEYTAPLLWTGLNASHRAVVIEMAMRGRGQIQHLASFSRPNVGVITNIGYSHVELLGSRDGIYEAKRELLNSLPADGTAVLWYDDEYFSRLRDSAPCKVVSFGFNPKADCRVAYYSPLNWAESTMEVYVFGKVARVQLPYAGRHMALNASAALLVSNVLGVDLQRATTALTKTGHLPLRMEVRAVRETIVVLDAYNASPASMIAAIETLSEMPSPGRKFAVLGDMLELGAFSDEAHAVVGRAVSMAHLDQVLFYGDAMQVAKEVAMATGTPPYRTSSAVRIEEVTRFLNQLEPGDTVLIKGSRALGLERAVEPRRSRHPDSVY